MIFFFFLYSDLYETQKAESFLWQKTDKVYGAVSVMQQLLSQQPCGSPHVFLVTGLRLFASGCLSETLCSLLPPRSELTSS